MIATTNSSRVQQIRFRPGLHHEPRWGIFTALPQTP